MNIGRVAGLIAVAIAGGSCSQASPPPGSGRWFLDGLQSLADKGALFNPAAVEQSLDMKFSAQARQLVPQPPICSNDYADKSRVITSYSSANPVWLRPTGEGMKAMEVPAFTINPAGISGTPGFSYSDVKVENCSGKFSLMRSRQARLQFDALPAFACFSRDYLVQSLHATHVFATDGVDLVEYRGAANDQFATNLQFVFRAGADCALSAELSQATDNGYRYLRAQAKWRSCKAAAHRKFCSVNRPVAWADGGKIDQMEEAAVHECGSLTSAYEREPLSGRPPPVTGFQISQSPCSN